MKAIRLTNLFKNKDLADCNIPDHVINTCQVLNKNLKYIDSELVCESLKETNDLNDFWEVSIN